MCACSGSTSPFEVLAMMAAVWCGSLRDLPGASFAVAVAAYLGLHPILLVVRPGHPKGCQEGLNGWEHHVLAVLCAEYGQI